MKKILFLVLILFSFAMSTAAEDEDIVVLLDVSKSVFSSFERMTDYVIDNTFRDHVSVGDYIHIITFNGETEVYISQEIDNDKDLQDIIKTVYLTYPFGKYTDLFGAFQFFSTYIAQLPAERNKVICILTDGIHDPPPGSSSQRSEEEVQSLIEETIQGAKQKGWSVEIVKVPHEQEGEQEKIGEEREPSKDYLTEETEGIEQTQRIEDKSVQQGKTTGASRDQVERETSRETSRDQTERETSKETSQGERERETITETSRTSREEREQETSREATQEQAEEKEAEGKGAAADRDSTRAFAFLRDNDKLFTWLIIGFLVAIAVVFLIILIIRNGGFALLSPQKGFKTLMNVYRGGSSADRAIEMTVRGQNPNIGFRNVKHIKKGQSRSVGGKNSDFLIFFVPLPAKIGSITRKDDTYSFRPVKKEFFPDIEGDIEDCLGKEIRAVTREGTFTITFIFKKYISKLEQVNRIMHLIDEPGTPRE